MFGSFDSLPNLIASVLFRNAWQKLGDLSQQEAMSQYVEIVTRLSPGWDAGIAGSSSNEQQQEQQEPRKHKSEQPMGPVFSSMAMPLEQDDHTSSNPEVCCAEADANVKIKS